MHPNIGERELNWKYWQARSDRPGPRSFVFVQQNEIVAHAGVVEGNWVGSDLQRRTAHLADWAARPDAAGAGVALMKYVARSFGATLIAIGGSVQTQRLLPFLGFQTVGGVMRYALPLRPSRILNVTAASRWRRFGRMARAYCWSARRPHVNGGEKATAIRVAPGSVAATIRDFPEPRNGTFVFKRSAALFEYALSSPTTPTELFACEIGGNQRGYFLLTFAPEQARLVDYWVPSDDLEDWRSLLGAAIREAMARPVAEIVTWASDAYVAKLCISSGFRARGILPVQALGGPGTTLPKGTTRVHMLENDSAFGQHGVAELWL